MQEYVLTLPNDLRRMRIVSAEQVALAMAGLPGFRSINSASFVNPYEKTTTLNYLEIILQAIENGEISCKRSWMDYSGNVTGAEFYAEEIWPWVIKELSDPSPWFGASCQSSLSLSQRIMDNSPEHGLNVHDDKTVHIEDFADKDFILRLVAGLALTISEKLGGKFKKGDVPNASSIGEEVARVLNKVQGLEAESLDGRDFYQRHRKVISKAIKDLNHK
ncbi:hypothetical protein [Pectobacterium versatile]|uniref:hypothetical protein n=1 Tax=Pectobacterium versatile TaxID=2488639 RepID=UPI001F16AD43|nr:hypothetical protein [Pectobacterium versatile]